MGDCGRKRLVYLKHTWMDVVRVLLVVAGIFLCAWIPAFVWIDPSVWITSPMIGVNVFLFLVIAEITAIALWMREFSDSGTLQWDWRGKAYYEIWEAQLCIGIG